MNTPSRHFSKVSLLVLPFLGFSTLAIAEHTIADSLNVQGNAYISGDVDLGGTVFMGSLPQDPQMEGFRVEVEQGSWQQSWSNWIDGYTSYQTVVQEVYGEIPYTTYNETWDYVQVGTNDYPDVYDVDGNLVSAGYSEPRYEYQMTGSTSYSGTYWGVTGTQEVQEPTWHDGYYDTFYGDTVFDAPRIKMTSSRSDASWVWRNPSSSGVPGETKDLMVLSEGGLSFPPTPQSLSSSTIGQHNLTFDGGAEYLNNYSGYSNTRTDVSAGAVGSTHTFQQWNAPSTSPWTQKWEQSTSSLQPHILELRRSETKWLRSGGSQGETTVTQIAAKSAHFGGVVTVEGNFNSKGVIRVMPAGDLGMGQFHRGLKPDGTMDNGGN